ncbi:hypothetical protein VCRA2122O339_290039 [Vibrio crassostreae]|nr:hypothetical protein VCRA2122O339_290039 [Vibrio crassostreae]
MCPNFASIDLTKITVAIKITILMGFPIYMFKLNRTHACGYCLSYSKYIMR